MKKILAAGDIIWDVYPDKNTIGGSAFNFAAHVACLGHESVLLSATGPDKLGADALQELDRFSVSGRYMQKNEHPTGQCLVTLDENKVPTFRVIDNVAYDYLELTDDCLSELKNERFDALYFGTLPERREVSRKTVQSLVTGLDCPVRFCDLNLRTDCYDAESVGFNLSHANVLKISDEEEPLCRALGLYSCDVSAGKNAGKGSAAYETVTHAIAVAFPNLEIILLTLGAEGSFALETKTGKTYYQPPVKVKAVSTVGAGDSYSAAWLCSYLEGKGIAASMKKAAEVSAFVVAHKEAVPFT